MASTITLVSSSPNSTVHGQPVTFTATVVPLGPGAPTGTVTFVIRGGPTLTAPVIGGRATVSTNGLSPGTYSVTAIYSGDSRFTSSTGASSHPVLKALTTTYVSSSPEPSTFGQPVTFTASVAPVPPGAGTPTGTVTFFISTGLSLTAPLVNGTARITTGALGPGLHVVVAIYSGDINFLPSTGTDTHTVRIRSAATRTTVTSAPDPSAVGQPVQFTATVAPLSPGSGTPTGTVTFSFGDGTPSVTASLSGGVARVTHPYASAAGSPYTVTATYGGDGSFGPSTGSDTQTVGRAATTTSVATSPDPSVPGQPVTVTASVAPAAGGGGTPTGTVTFAFGDGTPPVTATLFGGVATVTHPYASAAGSPFTVTATYGGDTAFGPSTGTDTHTVGRATTTTTVASSPDPSAVGQPVTFTATVAGSGGGGTPAGNVTFSFGDGTPTVTAALSGGVATATHTYTSASGSPYTVTAAYGGSADSGPSTGTDTHTVGRAATTTSVATSPDPSVPGQAVNVTASVAPLPPGAGTPTGTVTFQFGDGTPSVTATLSGGVATTTHVYADADGSPYTVTATYGGDTGFGTSSSTDTHTVGRTTTTTTVLSSPDPSAVGQQATFTATVVPGPSGTGLPTGTVTFSFGDGSPAVEARLSGGVATVGHTFTGAAGSPYTVTASYGGDTVFTASTGTDTHTVNPAVTTTTVTGSPDPSSTGQPVTFTAVVAPVAPGAGSPSGTVTFDFGDGSPTVGAPVSGGIATATHTYTAAPAGPLTVTAAYGGNADFAGSTGTETHTVNQAATATAVATSPDPSVAGAAVTVTATVTTTSPGAGTPTGTVTFSFGDGTPSVTASLSGGTATTTHVYADADGSPFTVTASYGGSADFGASTGTDTHTVGRAATTTTVVSSPDPSVVGEPASFTATVSGGAGEPTGRVTFDFGDGTAPVTVSLSGGVATVSHAYAGASGSPYTVTAAYAGDAASAPSSGTDAHAVAAAATATTVTSSPDPSPAGQPVTFTAVVASVAPGSGTPAGSVAFDFGDGSPVVNAVLTGGVATATHVYADASGSPYAVTASYGGNADFGASTGTDTHTVDAVATTTSVTSSPDPSAVGQPVTFTATVTPQSPGAGVPSGTVTFTFGDGGPPQSVPLAGGVATVTHPYADASGSPYQVTATYHGDDGFAGSTGTDTQSVDRVATTTAVTSSPDPSVAGQQVAFTATVAPGSGTGTPTGRVTFDFGDGSTPVAAVLTGGAATVNHGYAEATGSPYTVTVTYDGDAGFAPSTGTDTQTLVEAATTTTVTSSPDPAPAGQAVLFTATVVADSVTASPTGSVVFDFGDGTAPVTVALADGLATHTHTYTTSAGSPFTVTATYGGDSNFGGSVGTDEHEVSDAPTTTSVQSPEPSVVGEPVTFTATVAPEVPEAGAPSGTVTFTFGDGLAPVTVPVTGGTATVTHTYENAAGSPFTVAATFEGDEGFASSTGTDTHVVGAATTSTSVVSSPDPSVVGESVTFTATVTPEAPGSGTPSGSVVFEFGDGSPTVTAAVSGGVATATHVYATAAEDPFAVVATYEGDVNFAASTGADTQTVSRATTATTVTTSPHPSAPGQAVTVISVVTSGTAAAGAPDGTVTVNFGDGSPPVVLPLSGGVATVVHNYPAVGGPFTVTAMYGGTEDFTPSVGTDTHTQQDDIVTTTTSLVSSPDPSVTGQSVTFTATVTPLTSGGTPTGTVTFLFGDSTPPVTAPLVGGVATVGHTFTSAVGSPHTVVATYSGDDEFSASTGLDTHTVNRAATTTTLVSSPDPSVTGQPVAFTATIAPVAPGAGVPTGNVTFDFGDGSPAVSAALSGGAATVEHPYTAAAGSLTVTATYDGDAGFAASTGTDTQTVNRAATTTTVSSSPDPSVVGQPVTFTITVTT
ncbi:Ig-like domain repeat protein, partial [Streptomyces sp. bgisy100]|uniref:Ig-like domain repeat protein n=1 Tax=Streptomyces sp. bgisy100 TaxID=3413783 RepID=UPI003D733A75